MKGKGSRHNLIPIGQAEEKTKPSTSKEECLIPQHLAKSLLLQKMGTQLPWSHIKRKLLKVSVFYFKICPVPFSYACMSWSISLRQSLVTHTPSFNWFTQVSEQGIITSWKTKPGRLGQPAPLLWDLKVQNKGGSGFIPQFNHKLQTAWDAILAEPNHKPTHCFFISVQPGY